MNKPVYLALSVLNIGKTMMCVFWYDYIKPKYQDNAKPYYMDTNILLIYIKNEDFH